MSRVTTSILVCVSLVVGCGGSCPQAADASSAEPEAAEPASEAPEPSEEPAPAEDKAEPKEEASSASAEDEPKADGKKDEGGPEPSFPENASVAQAIGAVPQGTQRANIDAETLAEPLNKPDLYEPCQVGAQHFKLKVAVWNGHAVGVDVTTPNKKLAACIDKQVRAIEWHDKVRSLNTVEYSM